MTRSITFLVSRILVTQACLFILLGSRKDSLLPWNECKGKSAKVQDTLQHIQDTALILSIHKHCYIKLFKIMAHGCRITKEFRFEGTFSTYLL